MGRKGDRLPGEVLRFGMPRKDLHVVLQGVEVKPALALGSWAAFHRAGGEAMVMGDLVLTEDEVAPVMRVLEAGDVEIAALHNHLILEQPRVVYLHIGGHGDAVKIATAIRTALAQTKTPASSAPAAAEPQIAIDVAAIEQILGRKGNVSGGVLHFSAPRAEKITEDGMETPPSMGAGTVINLQPTTGGKAAIAGDFALLGTEVNPVIRALQTGGITVTAVHSHALADNPRLFYMHFWANDDPLKLAKTLRNALDATKSAK